MDRERKGRPRNAKHHPAAQVGGLDKCGARWTGRSTGSRVRPPRRIRTTSPSRATRRTGDFTRNQVVNKWRICANTRAHVFALTSPKTLLAKEQIGRHHGTTGVEPADGVCLLGGGDSARGLSDHGRKPTLTGASFNCRHFHPHPRKRVRAAPFGTARCIHPKTDAI